MKQNIGIAGRYVRLVTGILALNCSANTHRRNHLGRNLLVSLGAMKIAEGVIGWCPTVEICNRLFSDNGNNGSSSSNISQSKEQKPSGKPSDLEHKNTEQAAQPHHADHSTYKSKPEPKFAESLIMQNDKSHSESKTEAETEIEAF